MDGVLLARVTAVLWVLAAVAVAFEQAAVAPAWILGLVSRAGGSPELGIRLVAGGCVMIGGLLLACGGKARGPAIVSAALLAFSGIADLSARLSLGLSPVPAGVSLVVGIVLAVLLLRTSPPERRLRHPGVAGLLGFGSLVAGAAVAANLQVMPVEPLSRGRGADGRYLVHDLTASDDWVGRPLEDTGLLDHLPQIRGLLQDQPALIALYRPNCGSCHDLFDGWLAEPMAARLISVRVPPAEGVELAESDLPEDVTCASCVRMALPEGPVWLVETPVLIEVVDGKVACVSTADFDRCVDHAVAAAEAYFAEEAGVSGS